MRGFTLIELMLVLAIVGVLSAIAIPNYNRTQARTKQSEAKMNLKAIYVGAKSRLVAKDDYAQSATSATALDDIGWAIERNARYTYRFGGQTFSPGAASAGTASTITTGATKTFLATAAGNVDADAFMDEWLINGNNVMCNDTGLGATDTALPSTENANDVFN